MPARSCAPSAPLRAWAPKWPRHSMHRSCNVEMCCRATCGFTCARSNVWPGFQRFSSSDLNIFFSTVIHRQASWHFVLRCADGFYGDPLAKGGSCKACECSGNIDSMAIGNCDRNTGRCLKCIYNTAGDHCEQCKENHWGSAKDKSCQSCDCHPKGSPPFLPILLILLCSNCSPLIPASASGVNWFCSFLFTQSDFCISLVPGSHSLRCCSLPLSPTFQNCIFKPRRLRQFFWIAHWWMKTCSQCCFLYCLWYQICIARTTSSEFILTDNNNRLNGSNFSAEFTRYFGAGDPSFRSLFRLGCIIRFCTACRSYACWNAQSSTLLCGISLLFRSFRTVSKETLLIS